MLSIVLLLEVATGLSPTSHLDRRSLAHPIQLQSHPVPGSTEVQLEPRVKLTPFIPDDTDIAQRPTCYRVYLESEGGQWPSCHWCPMRHPGSSWRGTFCRDAVNDAVGNQAEVLCYERIETPFGESFQPHSVIVHCPKDHHCEPVGKVWPLHLWDAESDEAPPSVQCVKDKWSDWNRYFDAKKKRDPPGGGRGGRSSSFPDLVRNSPVVSAHGYQRFRSLSVGKAVRDLCKLYGSGSSIRYQCSASIELQDDLTDDMLGTFSALLLDEDNDHVAVTSFEAVVQGQPICISTVLPFEGAYAAEQMEHFAEHSCMPSTLQRFAPADTIELSFVLPIDLASRPEAFISWNLLGKLQDEH